MSVARTLGSWPKLKVIHEPLIITYLLLVNDVEIVEHGNTITIRSEPKLVTSYVRELKAPIVQIVAVENIVISSDSSAVIT